MRDQGIGSHASMVLSRVTVTAAQRQGTHMCSIALTLPCRQFKYYAKDFGDNESERLATLIRLSGGRGNDLRKVISPVALL
jgi:hypothetical protein